MKVSVDGKQVFIGWKYENPELNMLLKALDIDEAYAKGILFDKGQGGEPRLLALINSRVVEQNKERGDDDEEPCFKSLPKPSITYCIFSDADKKEFASSKVVRHHKDPFDKDKARKYSFSKVLHGLYPGASGYGTRRAFWDVYVGRSQKPIAPVLRIVTEKPVV